MCLQAAGTHVPLSAEFGSAAGAAQQLLEGLYRTKLTLVLVEQGDKGPLKKTDATETVICSN